MRTKAAWRIIGAVIAGGAALATAILPASGATSAAQPAWRVVKTFGPAVGVWTDQLTAVSGRDSWSTSVACRTGPCGTSKGGLFVYVEHSGGTSWKAIRVAAALTAGVAQSRPRGQFCQQRLARRSARQVRQHNARVPVERLPVAGPADPGLGGV